MSWRNMIAASLLAGTVFGLPAASADGSQCGESVLLEKQPLSKGYVRENAELRGIQARLPDGLTRGLDAAMTALDMSTGIDIARSLYIRDSSLLEAFSFADVMDTLASGLGEDAPSGLVLFQDWWRTAAPADPKYAADIGCTETLINGFPYTCANGSRTEPLLQKISDLRTGRNGGPPFTIIGLVNRGDLVFGQTDPNTCGEYRVIAAADSTMNPATDDLAKLGALGEFFLSFEAALPNSKDGLCLAVQRFWQSIALKDDESARRMLRTFFLEKAGLTKDGTISAPPEPGADFTFGPVISAVNLGLLPQDAKSLGIQIAQPFGQIRTNTRNANPVWLLRQYSFRKTSRGVRITPTALSSTPPVQIMRPGRTCGSGNEDCNDLLAEEVWANRDGLATNEVTALSFKLTNNCLAAGEMMANNTQGDGYVNEVFAHAAPTDTALRNALQKVADIPGLPDLPTKIGQNLQMTSCAGCHQHSTKTHLSHLVAMPGSFPIKEKIGRAHV